jgi:hypothetical protein
MISEPDGAAVAVDRRISHIEDHHRRVRWLHAVPPGKQQGSARKIFVASPINTFTAAMYIMVATPIEGAENFRLIGSQALS